MLVFAVMLAMPLNRDPEWPELMGILRSLGAEAFVSYAELNGYERRYAIERAMRYTEDARLLDDLRRLSHERS